MAVLLNLKLWAYAALAVLILAVLGFVYRAGGASARHDLDAYKLTQVESARKAALARAKAYDKAATDHEAFKALEEKLHAQRQKIVTRIVTRPVYLRECFDADGLGLLNDAIAGRASAGQPAPAVPGPAKPAR